MANFYKITKIIPALVLLTSLYGCSKFISGAGGEAPPPAESWAVVKISDGDTLKLRQTDGREMKVRLACIDANESKQEGGQQAKAYLKKLVEQADNVVMVSPVTTDRYNRTVAEVFVSLKDGSEQFIQEEMVKAGMARAYPQYISSCPNKSAILRAEEIARLNRAGVWANPNSVQPWIWRQKQRQNKDI